MIATLRHRWQEVRASFWIVGAAGSRGLLTPVASSRIKEEGTITPPLDMTVLDDIRNWKWRS